MNLGTFVAIAGAGTAAPSAASALTPLVAAAKAARSARAAAPGARGGAFLDGLAKLDQAGAQRRAEQLGALLGRLGRSALARASSGTHSTSASKGASKSTSASAGGALAFLKDPKLSVEEKLARLMIQLSDKYEKELDKKLQQFSDLENGKATSGSSSGASKKSSGSAGSFLKSGLSSLFSSGGLQSFLTGPAMEKLLGQVTGPVLAGAATALGMPFLAPAILEAGPMLGGLASGALSAFADPAAAASSSSKTSTSSKSGAASGSSSSSSSSAPSEKALMTEIQILQEKQKEMFTLVSNILRSQHDTKMAVISNVR